MMTCSRIGVLVAVAGVALGTAPASAFVSWANANGAGSFFNWTGGGSNLGLFGNPTLGGGGNLFVFTPQAFTAAATGGSAQTTTDQLQVRLTAHQGHEFTQIRISELGNFALTGIGSGSVRASGTMFITDMLNSRPTEFGAMSMNPAFPVTVVPSTGTYAGQVIINLANIGVPWTDITLQFTNTLQATSSGQTSASISKNRVEIEIVPAPGAASLLCLGGLLAARRRRR
jgi:hypothetical protein